MKEVIIIGVDLAKNVFQLHGAAADGSVVFRKKLTRVQFHKFMSGHPACCRFLMLLSAARIKSKALSNVSSTPDEFLKLRILLCLEAAFQTPL